MNQAFLENKMLKQLIFLSVLHFLNQYTLVKSCWLLCQSSSLQVPSLISQSLINICPTVLYFILTLKGRH